MSSSLDFVVYITEQISHTWDIRYRKMFGDYMIYLNDKPVILVSDNVPYVKKLPEIEHFMENASCGFPYKGAKEHFVLDVDDRESAIPVLEILESIIPYPKEKKHKAK